MAKYYRTIDEARQAGWNFNFNDFALLAGWPCIVTLVVAAAYYGGDFLKDKSDLENVDCMKKEIVIQAQNKKFDTDAAIVIGGGFLFGSLLGYAALVSNHSCRGIDVKSRYNEQKKRWEYTPVRVKQR